MSLAARLRGSAIEAYLRLGPPERIWHAVARRAGGSTPRIVFWHQVDDPWSHLLAQALPSFLQQHPRARVSLRVVPPPSADADPEPLLRSQHAMRDAAAIASLYPALTFPVRHTLPARDRVRRANAALLALPEDGAPETVAAAIRVGNALWSEDADALQHAVVELGALPGHRIDPALEQAYRALRQAGHYQGAMLQYGGEFYWGIDRLPHLSARLAEKGAPKPLLPSLTPLPPPATMARGTVEMFFSFRSPYSYLALAQLMERYEPHAVNLVLRPVLPMVTRGLSVPDAKRLYIARDAYREAQRLAIPFGKLFDPLGSGVARCLSLWNVVPEASAPRMAITAMRMIWSEARDMARDDAVDELLQRCELPSELRAAADTDGSWQSRVEEHRRLLREELGLWGVPSFRVHPYPHDSIGKGGPLGDEDNASAAEPWTAGRELRVTWGQDRLDLVDRWLRGSS